MSRGSHWEQGIALGAGLGLGAGGHVGSQGPHWEVRPTLGGEANGVQAAGLPQFEIAALLRSALSFKRRTQPG